MEEKKVLEETLHREQLKWAATEQAMKDLEQQFADKERNWKVVIVIIVINCFICMTVSLYSIAKACIWQSIVEEELWGTISELQQQLRKQTCEEKSVKTPAAEAFSRMLSTSEGKSELLYISIY